MNVPVGGRPDGALGAPGEGTNQDAHNKYRLSVAGRRTAVLVGFGSTGGRDVIQLSLIAQQLTALGGIEIIVKFNSTTVSSTGGGGGDM